MSTKSIRRRIFDVTLGALSIAVGAFGLAHFQEWSFWKGAADDRALFVSVGDLVSQKGNVRYRLGHSAVWRDVGQMESVAFGDEILTAKDGHAKIAFKTGRSAEVLPNSLVVIRPPEAQRPEVPLVDIKKGKIRLTRPIRDGETIRIAALGKVYEIAAPPVTAAGGSQETTLEIAVPDETSRSIASDQKLIVQSDTAVVVKEVGSQAPETVISPTPEPVRTPDPSPTPEPVQTPPPVVPVAQSTPTPKPVPSPTETPVIKEEPAQASDVQVIAPAPAETNEPGPISHLSVELGFGYLRVDSQDRQTAETATLLTGLSPQVRLAWDLDWNEKYSSHIALSTTYEKILDDTGTSPRSIENASGMRSSGEIGLVRRWSDSSRSAFSLGIAERLFERAPSTTTLSIDRILSPSLRFGHELDFMRVKTATMGLALSAEAIFGGRGPGYTTDTGYGGDVSLYLRHEMKSATLHGALNYGFSKQDSSLVEQSEKRLGVSIGISWRLGE